MRTAVAPRPGSIPKPATQLACYRGAAIGQPVVVCGCAPSLHELSDPQRFITIGVNDVGRLFDPTYLVVVNPRSQFKGDRFRYVEHSKAQAVFTQLDLGPIAPPVVRFKLGRYGGTDDASGQALHYTQNSPYVAVCLAALMGAKRIGLIGVDLTDHHFFAATGRHSLAGRIREIDEQYGRLAKALRLRGVELVNLSPVSRLASLPRAALDGEGGWTPAQSMLAAVPRPPVPAPRAHPAGSTPMKVAIEKRPSGVMSEMLDALARTATGLGHSVSRDPRRAATDPQLLSIVWNGRVHQGRGPVLYCEHGWLPRSDYQISPRGINAGSHAAPFAWNGEPLTSQQDEQLDARFAAIKSASFTGYYQYMQAGMAAAPNLPAHFLLVPLQIESDTNIVRHAPAHLRTMQGLVDYVSRLDPPWPVIFKQHPADLRHGNRHLRLRTRRPQDKVWPQSRGNVHQMLKSGQCRGILTINSNVAHDGLLWDVPSIVLGRNVWPSSGEETPFLTAIPKDWSVLAASVVGERGRACRRAYAHYLMSQQWSLADVRDPAKVAALLHDAALSHAATAGSGARMSAKVRSLRPPAGPTINVVAEDRGWLFDVWKRQLAATAQEGYSVVASAKPLRQADAWIFVRAREALGSPQPARSVVQLHDLFDDGRYAPGGERAAVLRCGGLSLTHPHQQVLLEAQGVRLAERRWLLQPAGWTGPASAAGAMGAVPTVAWVGRPAKHGGVDVSRLDAFVEAARSLRGQARIVLVGERVDAAAAALRRAGVECSCHGLAQFPIDRTSEWIARFDAVVICGAAGAGPWPLFDAINAGVPVVATQTGWAETLLTDGQCGLLVDEPAALGDAIRDVIARRPWWRQQRAVMQQRVGGFSLAAWSQANLQLAASLAGHSLRVAA